MRRTLQTEIDVHDRLYHRKQASRVVQEPAGDLGTPNRLSQDLDLDDMDLVPTDDLDGPEADRAVDPLNPHNEIGR